MLDTDQINDLHRLYRSEHWSIRRIERHLKMCWRTDICILDLMKKAAFEQLGFDQRESAVLRLRSQMMNALIAEMEGAQLTQAALANQLGISQPRVSDLLRGKLHLFSADMSITLLAQMGMDVRAKVRKRAA